MRRRTLITGAAASGIGGITLIGSGAFDTATAERTATVNFADDEDAYLGLISESEYAIKESGELVLDFTNVSADGDGVGRNSEYYFDTVFAIANQGTEPVSITASSDTESFDGDFRLYPTGDRSGTLDDDANAVHLGVGDQQLVGTHIQTGDVDTSDDVDIDIVIEAAFDDEGGDEPEEPEPEPPEQFDELEFFSTSSLVAENGDPLTDDSVVAVWAEPTAENENPEGDSEFVSYPDDVDIPLAAADETVVGFGSELGPDASDEDDNRTHIVNAWQTVLDGTGTVLYDETHGQDLTLDDFSALESVAADRGFDVDAIGSEFVDALDDADAVMVATDSTDVADAGGFTGAERSAVADFVDDGGAVFLHGTASFDGTSNGALNEVLDELDAAFRFNVDQVIDEENSGFAPFVPRTDNFNDDEFPDFFLAEGEL